MVSIWIYFLWIFCALILLCCCFQFQKKLAMDFSGRSISIVAIVTPPRPVSFVFSITNVYLWFLKKKMSTWGSQVKETCCCWARWPSTICAVARDHPILLLKFYTNLQGQARHKVESVAQEYFGRWCPLQSLRRRQAGIMCCLTAQLAAKYGNASA